MKPKKNVGNNPGTYDNCQTPPYALDPLIPYLDRSKGIFESAAGAGVLVRRLEKEGFYVTDFDIQYDMHLDFFKIQHGESNLIQVTNPPYSVKYRWASKSFDLGMPFALLMPIEMLGTEKGWRIFDEQDPPVEVIFLSPRVDFYMPNKGWEGGGAQFPTAWFTWKLNLPQQINFARLNKPKRSELEEYWRKALGK
jgi:hypothetical protein